MKSMPFYSGCLSFGFLILFTRIATVLYFANKVLCLLGHGCLVYK